MPTRMPGGASLSCTRLAREALVTSQTMIGIVKDLEAKGLVSRRTLPDHSRVVLVSLTPAGVDRARSADRLRTEVEQAIHDAFPDGDHRVLIALLEQIVGIAPTAGPATEVDEQLTGHK